MGIMRGDDYQKLGEAYTNLIEATIRPMTVGNE